MSSKWINAGGWWVRSVKEKDVPQDGRYGSNPKRGQLSVMLETFFNTDPTLEVIEVSDYSISLASNHRQQGWKLVTRGNSAFFYRPEETP